MKNMEAKTVKTLHSLVAGFGRLAQFLRGGSRSRCFIRCGADARAALLGRSI